MALPKAIATAVFRKMAGRGFTTNAIIRAAESLGGSYRYQTMRNDINLLENRAKWESAITALRPETPIPEYMMSSTDLQDQAKYRVHGQATFFDEETGKEFQQRVSFYTNDWDDQESQTEAFAQTFGSAYQEESLGFTSFQRTATDIDKTYMLY